MARARESDKTAVKTALKTALSKLLIELLAINVETFSAAIYVLTLCALFLAFSGDSGGAATFLVIIPSWGLVLTFHFAFTYYVVGALLGEDYPKFYDEYIRHSVKSAWAEAFKKEDFVKDEANDEEEEESEPKPKASARGRSRPRTRSRSRAVSIGELGTSANAKGGKGKKVAKVA